MRIAFHIAQLGGGGAERVMALLANHFAAKRDEVYLIANKPCAHEYVLDGAIHKVYLDGDGEKARGFATRNVSRIRLIRNICKREKIDCLVSFMAEPNIRSVISCIGLKTKNIVSVRNDPEKEYPGKMLSCARAVFSLTSCVVVQTNDAARCFKKGNFPIRVIPNPVSDAFYSVSRNPESRRIVSVGRLEPQKNHEMLIDSFAMIQDFCAGYTLDIFGAGSLEKSLKEKVQEMGLSDRVLFHGLSQAIDSELSDAAVFVMSSDYEGMPNALMEAMAAAVPVVSTDCPCGGPADLIDDGRNGILISVGATSEMASAVGRLLSDKKFANEIAKNARLTMENYRTQRICDEWERTIAASLAR